MSESRQQPHFIRTVPIDEPVLERNDTNDPAGTHDWCTKHCFKMVLGKVLECLESRIIGCTRSDRDRLLMFCHPAGDTLANLNPHVIHKISVRILGGTHHQVLSLKHIDEARVARDHARYKTYDAIEYQMKGISSSNSTTNLMEEVDLR